MLWFIFCKSDLLLKVEADGTYTVPEGDSMPLGLVAKSRIHTITPMEDGTEVRTCLVDAPGDSIAGIELCPLRMSFYKIKLACYLKAGKCQEILHWDQHTQYCGVCGAPMKMHTDISKRCQSCGNESWPLLATAVITLIHRGDELLMVKSRNFRGNYYGLVAGFVETGESLEEAALREIREEVGIEVKNLKYAVSQTWPYPAGLMIGFTAEYESGDIKLQYSELADGGWYHRDSLPPLPGEMGIARAMIENWLKSAANG